MSDLYLDNDVAYGVASALEQRGHSARTTRDTRLYRAPDGQQLLHAAKNDWILLTHNANDYLLLHDAWLRWTADWAVANTHSGSDFS